MLSTMLLSRVLQARFGEIEQRGCALTEEGEIR